MPVIRCLVIPLVAALFASAQTSRTVVKIAGSVGHKLVLFSDGTLGGWGDTRDGQLGPRAGLVLTRGHSTTFVPIALPPGAGKVVDIAGGERTSYVVLESGAVLAFGYGANGELGCGEPGVQGSETPVAVAGLAGVLKVQAQGAVALALHRDGTVSAWGSRDSGRLGDGLTPPKALTPVRVAGLSGVVELSIGPNQVLARTSEGAVLEWGRRQYGSDEPGLAPHPVEGLHDVVRVVATGVGAVLKKDGTVWVWGSNGQAQFGNGRRTADEKARTPVRVPGVTNAVELAGADVGRHFLVLLRDGSVRGWGNSDWGQVGNGVHGEEQASVAVVRVRDVKKIFAVGNHSFAIKGDQSLWIWGAGANFRKEWPLAKQAVFPVVLNLDNPESIP